MQSYYIYVCTYFLIHFFLSGYWEFLIDYIIFDVYICLYVHIGPPGRVRSHMEINNIVRVRGINSKNVGKRAINVAEINITTCHGRTSGPSRPKNEK